jgi:hypothetical protein
LALSWDRRPAPGGIGQHRIRVGAEPRRGRRRHLGDAVEHDRRDQPGRARRRGPEQQPRTAPEGVVDQLLRRITAGLRRNPSLTPACLLLYVRGLAAKRELPIIRRIAMGSLRNKLLIILPAALLLSAIDLPANATAWGRQMLQAAMVCPGITVDQACVNDRRTGLMKARDLIDAMLAEVS